jgi:hypothetical protein
MKKKAEFSKVIITSVSIATALVVIASFVLMFIYGDLSPLTYIIGGCFAELASATGFYYWKAKNENVLKIKGYGDNPDTDQTAEQEGGAVG